MNHKELGIAVVGAGRIGTLRASMAAAHPAVRFVAISDIDPERARSLCAKVGGQLSSGDNLEVISRPEVNAVIVSTSEHEHALPILQALERGKPVLVEKPIAVDLEDADRILAAAARSGVEVRIGYSRRHQRHYLLAKEQILQGRLGKIEGANGRVYLSRPGMLAILKRSPHATPVVDILTYYVDLCCWFMEGIAPVEVVARGHGTIFKAAGFHADDVTWAIITFADGAVVSLGVFGTLPDDYPICGQSHRLEILGTEGVMLFDEDHKEQFFYTERDMSRGMLPGPPTHMAFLSSTPPGDWALGDFWGPLASESRAWLDHLSMGRPCALATPAEARKVLQIALAIEHSARTKKTVSLAPGSQAET